MRRLKRAAISAGVAVASLAGMGGIAGASQGSHHKNVTEPTITVWDQNTTSNLDPIYNHLVSLFEKQYHVKVDRITKPFTQILQQQKLALSGPNPPDIVQSNQGYGAEGPEAAAKLIVPLDKYAKQYHWASCQPSSILNGGDFSSDGKHFGSGRLYGVSDILNLVGVYYNKALLNKIHVSQQISTLTDFQSVLAKAKKAGITPIAFGDLEQWPGIHEYQSLWDVYAPSAQALTRYVYGTGPATAVTPYAKQAATTLQTWAKDGYFESGFNGVTYENGTNAFLHGKALFYIDGNWVNGSVAPVLGKNVGVMLMPEAKAGAPVLATGSGGNAYVIAARSKHQALAAEYLNFIACSSTAAKYFISQGQVPLYLPKSVVAGVQSGTTLAQWIHLYNQVAADNGVIMFMDLSTDDGTTYIGQQLQSLLGLKMQPSSFVQAIESDYSHFHSSL
ncbi:MAG: hypothetical protein JWM85_3228 [Acidimicrobiaceae bacterium]|nr:hypothetical protein [Acidimicrobiaceae bacterium]